jgi:murein tripeptide amidase MpaA
MNWTDYINVAEVEQVANNLANTYPSLVRLIRMPNTSVGGKECHALWLGQGDAADKDVIMIIGGVHGLEWGSCEIALNLAIDLLGSATDSVPLVYGGKTYTSEEISGLLAATHIVVFPLVNPDGRDHSQHIDPIWRKNLNPAYTPRSGGRRGGVDLNRNYDFLFDYRKAFAPNVGVCGSDDPPSPYYRGPQPFSEPETCNVRWLLDQFSRTRWFVDLHACAGHDFVYVWGDDEAQDQTPVMRFDNSLFDGQRGLPGDTAYREYMATADQRAVTTLAGVAVAAIAAVAGTAYTARASYELYPTFGVGHDYAYSRHIVEPSKTKTLGFAIEWGLDPHPDWAVMVPTIRDVCAGLIAFCIAARNS